jgi:hypothetical protein
VASKRDVVRVARIAVIALLVGYVLGIVALFLVFAFGEDPLEWL